MIETMVVQLNIPRYFVKSGRSKNLYTRKFTSESEDIRTWIFSRYVFGISHASKTFPRKRAIGRKFRQKYTFWTLPLI